MARLAKEKAVGTVFPGEGNMRSSTAMVGDERWTENSVVPKLGGGRRVTDGRSTMGESNERQARAGCVYHGGARGSAVDQGTRPRLSSL